MENDFISAFAFNTGRQIEEIIKKETNNLHEHNRLLEAKLLSWYVLKGRDKEFADYFGITTLRNGKN